MMVMMGMGRGRKTLLHAVYVGPPEQVVCRVTFLAGAALLVGQEDVLTAAALQPLSLQKLVHPLDDALQTLVHVHPHLLLENHGKGGERDKC